MITIETINLTQTQHNTSFTQGPIFLFLSAVDDEDEKNNFSLHTKREKRILFAHPFSHLSPSREEVSHTHDVLKTCFSTLIIDFHADTTSNGFYFKIRKPRQNTHPQLIEKTKNFSAFSNREKVMMKEKGFGLQPHKVETLKYKLENLTDFGCCPISLFPPLSLHLQLFQGWHRRVPSLCLVVGRF